MANSVRDRKITTDNYSKFLSELELFSIALIRSTCRVNRKEYLHVDDTNVSFKLSSKSLQVHDSSFDVCSTLRLKVTSEKSGDLQLWITATFEMHIHGAAPLAPEFIERFCDSEVRLIVWPYFREYVGNMSTRMHIPPFILPLRSRESKPSRSTKPSKKS
jgi:hypothetical protein